VTGVPTGRPSADPAAKATRNAYPMNDITPPPATFGDLGLPASVLTALERLGYETPTGIQLQTIPPLLEGHDVLGHAPTGTGKTAAFALPLVARIDPSQRAVQALVLVPTRELALQVAEAFARYAAGVDGFHVLPVYGGQAYDAQIRALKRSAHVVVGTPGRVIDHMRRGTLNLSKLATLVLDEADEMLRMGFIDDVEWILGETPPGRQIALFSATMPDAIQRIARSHLDAPHEITVHARTAAESTIRQRYWLVSGVHKLDALTRILEVESFDAIIVFVRTKTATVELAERLAARGFAAAALSGDLPQKAREQVVDRLKRGAIDIVVATDVAARGLDVDRVSHVVNYDIPYDTEAYVHRIGRTGRAGRHGEAILFVAPRERRMLAAIEKATRRTIDRLELPSTEAVNSKRIADFEQTITDTIAAGDLDFLRGIVERYEASHDVPAIEIAAALAKMAIGERPLLVEEEARPARAAEARDERTRKPKTPRQPGVAMDRYRVEVGREHGVKPGNIMGAIANEAGLDARHIGRIEIRDDHSLVELPKGMPREVFEDLKRTRVCGALLAISREGGRAPGAKPAGKSPAKRGSGGPRPAGKPRRR